MCFSAFMSVTFFLIVCEFFRARHKTYFYLRHAILSIEPDKSRYSAKAESREKEKKEGRF